MFANTLPKGQNTLFFHPLVAACTAFYLICYSAIMARGKKGEISQIIYFRFQKVFQFHCWNNLGLLNLLLSNWSHQSLNPELLSFIFWKYDGREWLRTCADVFQFYSQGLLPVEFIMMHVT